MKRRDRCMKHGREDRELTYCTFPHTAAYLDAVGGSVISELTEQLGQERLSCRSGEEATRTARESRDPLGPAHRHYRSNPKPSTITLHAVNM